MAILHICMGCGTRIETERIDSALGWIRAQVTAYHPPLTEGGMTGPMVHDIYACSLECFPAAARNAEPAGLPQHYENKMRGVARGGIVNIKKGDRAGGPLPGSAEKLEMELAEIEDPLEFDNKKRRGEIPQVTRDLTNEDTSPSFPHGEH